MATYEDLTPYVYGPDSEGMVNIGWLGEDSVFETGEIPNLAWEELVKRAGMPVSLMRGLHDCELCDSESPIRIPSPYDERGYVSLGSGEIHVRGVGGLTMAAPTLVLHYIAAHKYKPPREFVSALLADADA